MADEMDYMEQAKELADSYRLLVHRRICSGSSTRIPVLV